MEITEKEARIGKAIVKILSHLEEKLNERIILRSNGTVYVEAGTHHCDSCRVDEWDGTIVVAESDDGSSIISSVETVANRIEDGVKRGRLDHTKG